MGQSRKEFEAVRDGRWRDMPGYQGSRMAVAYSAFARTPGAQEHFRKRNRLLSFMTWATVAWNVGLLGLVAAILYFIWIGAQHA